MNKPNLNFLLTLGLIVLTVLTSCRRDNEKDDDTSAVQNESTAENYFNELSSIADQVATTGDLSGYKISQDQGALLSNCAVIVIDTSSFVSPQIPNTFTVDFGQGCVGSDNKTRSGKIIITATGPYLEAGTVVTIIPENYFVNGNQISGSRVVTNLGENSQGQPTFSIDVDGSIILANNEGTITWMANRVRTWSAGFNTPLLFFDDEFSLTGSANGTRVNGDTWTSQINTSLLYRHSCRQIVSGTFTLSPEGKPDRLVNFGSGDCDYSASVTINGNTFNFTVL